MNTRKTLSFAVPTTIAVALLASRAYAAFSTCRDRGYTTTPTTFCGDPRYGAAYCGGTICEGNRVWNGSTCGFSLNCCAGCNNGTGTAQYYEYDGSCTYAVGPWPFSASCNCSPSYLPSGLFVPVPVCSNYNACLP